MTAANKVGKNTALLNDFAAYCIAHPQERFWQALRNWSGRNFIYASSQLLAVPRLFAEDTFYWEGKNG